MSLKAEAFRTVVRCSSARIFAVLPQKPCTFPPSIKILGGKNTVYKVCKPIKTADKAVFIGPHSTAVGNKSQERLDQQTLYRTLFEIHLRSQNRHHMQRQ